MIVKCTYNRISDLPKQFDRYAITQDDNTGKLDISIGRHYAVFAIKDTDVTRWYFVYTDKENSKSPWWMPAGLYEVVDDSRPMGWMEKKLEDVSISAYPSLYVENTEVRIIDAEPEAIQAYMSDVRSDPTFPTEGHVEEWNQEFRRQEQLRQYEEDLRLAEERGYEYPTPPD